MSEEEMENRRAIKRVEKNRAVEIIELISAMTNCEGAFDSSFKNTSAEDDIIWQEAKHEVLLQNDNDILRSGKAAKALDKDMTYARYSDTYMDDPFVVAHLLFRSIKRSQRREREREGAGTAGAD
jgi:hypothetical protein